jgi:hypothetical protein
VNVTVEMSKSPARGERDDSDPSSVAPANKDTKYPGKAASRRRPTASVRVYVVLLRRVELSVCERVPPLP